MKRYKEPSALYIWSLAIVRAINAIMMWLIAASWILLGVMTQY